MVTSNNFSELKPQKKSNSQITFMQIDEPSSHESGISFPIMDSATKPQNDKNQDLK